MPIDLHHPKANRLLAAISDRDADTVAALVCEVTLSDGVLDKLWHTLLCDELDKGRIPGVLHRIVKSLVIDLGCDINKSGFMQKPILFYYLYYKEFDLADELLALGADVNARVLTGNRDENNEWLAEPLMCEFIQRMNPERDFPEDFTEQVAWLTARGAVASQPQ